VRATVLVRSLRGARVVRLRVDPAVAPKLLRVDSFTFESPVDGSGLIVHTVRRDGVEVELEFTPTKGSRLTVLDETPGLPPAARAIAEKRTAAMVPAHRGDRLLVSRTVGLTPSLR
jgi:hypothetical protein